MANEDRAGQPEGHEALDEGFPVLRADVADLTEPELRQELGRGGPPA